MQRKVEKTEERNNHNEGSSKTGNIMLQAYKSNITSSKIPIFTDTNPTEM